MPRGRSVRHRLIAIVAPAVLGLLALGLLSQGPVQGGRDGAALTTAPATSRPAGSGEPTPSWLSEAPSTPAPAGSPSASDSPSGPSEPAAGIALGAFIPGASSDASKIDAFSRMIGADPRIVMWYQRWSGEWSGFSAKTADAIAARGAMPMISWEPTAGPVDDAAWSLRSIVDGSHDAYIRKWVRQVAAWGHPIYVRPMYEMNGWWASWCVRANGNSARDFVSAWRHIVDLGRAAGATNIRWVWSPNVDNDGLGVPFQDLYPGDGYVDWVGLDGFNRGTSWSTTEWQSIEEIFSVSVGHLRQLTDKPILIGETGSSEIGGDKAAWIRNELAALPTSLPDVRAVVWFDKNETSLGIDWRINSSAASLKAFRELAGSAAFSGRLP